MRPQETVYLSLGAAANAASMHFWNAQQAYFDYSGRAAPPVVEHDVSFREGQGTDGLDTYTPRALLFDVRSEFGAMARINELYAAEDDSADYETVHTAEPVAPSEWSAPGTSARRGRPRYWSDYASVLFHPRSQVPVAAPALYGSSFLATPDADAATPAPCSFADGVRVAQAMEGEQRVMEEQVRWLAEDSDLMQGFQVAASASDTFSGVASAYLGYLADEYPKTERHTTLIARTMPAPYARVAAMNEVLALTHAAEHAHLVVPVHLQGAAQSRACVRPVWDDMHHAAAVVATLWETATLPTRCVHATYPASCSAVRVWRHFVRASRGAAIRPSCSWAAVRRRRCSRRWHRTLTSMLLSTRCSRRGGTPCRRRQRPLLMGTQHSRPHGGTARSHTAQMRASCCLPRCHTPRLLWRATPTRSLRRQRCRRWRRGRPVSRPGRRGA